MLLLLKIIIIGALGVSGFLFSQNSGLLLGLIFALIICFTLDSIYFKKLNFIYALISIVAAAIFNFFFLFPLLYFKFIDIHIFINLSFITIICFIFAVFFINQQSFKKTPADESGFTPYKTSFIPKILDSSVIIDGRVGEVILNNFIEGPIIIPQFIIGELQRIADSSDPLKRNRGRRGLDVLKMLQDKIDKAIIIDKTDFPKVKEVDSKLIHLALKINGYIITNDYNLNKVASLEGIVVLNLNDLVNSLKPVYLPGEKLKVQIIKEGKDAGQGVGYLEDGTMVVIDDGKKYIGKLIGGAVTSVLQTSAGRMIFVRCEQIINQAP